MRLYSVVVPVLFSAVAAVAAPALTQVTVMAYNVENFFDTTHDPGKLDWTYLPLTVKQNSKEAQNYCKSLSNATYKKDCQTINWDQALMDQKIKQISTVIRTVNNGAGPDVLVLEEIENLNAVKQLRDKGLAGLGYENIVVIEGLDERGIDVGLISKYPFVETPVYHPVKQFDPDGKAARATRGILEVKVKVGNAVIGVLGNHWPSQGNSDDKRVQAAETMLDVASHMKNVDAIVSMGDFNTLPTDDPNAIDDYVLNAGYGFPMIDSEAERRKSPTSGLPDGTHYYGGKWSSLDHIFVRISAPTKCSLVATTADYASFNIITTPISIQKNGTPLRFDYKKGTGVSDHLPVLLKLNIASNRLSEDCRREN